MKNRFILAYFLLGITLFNYAQAPATYYNTAEGKSGKELKAALHNIIKNHKVYSYDDLWVHLRYTDEDPSNTNNVILLYSGWSYPKSNNGGGVSQWNREHTWAKSQGNFGETKGPGTDLHHLRPTDVTVNSKRGSLMFDNGGTLYVDPSRFGGGDGNTGCYFDSNSWEAADRVKGDVARMLFYMAVRYEGNSNNDPVNLELAESSSTSGLHGKLSTLLLWDIFDPVSDWEKRRNNRTYELQSNRNPFIDHPELVDHIWGNKTGIPWSSSSDNEGEGGGDPACNNYSFHAPFTSSMNPFTSFNVTGTQNWSWQSADYGVVISGYTNNQNYENEDWLISPILDLENYTNIQLSFDQAINKGIANNMATENTLWISNNYDGGNPNTATWIQLTIPEYPDGNNWTFVNSGKISIPAEYSLTKTVIAFKYTSTTSASSTWEILNLSITGNCNTTNIKQIQHKKEHPVSINQKFITVFNLNGENVLLYDIFGRLISQSQPNTDNYTISVQASGIYILKIGKEIQKLVIR